MNVLQLHTMCTKNVRFAKNVPCGYFQFFKLSLYPLKPQALPRTIVPSPVQDQPQISSDNYRFDSSRLEISIHSGTDFLHFRNRKYITCLPGIIHKMFELFRSHAIEQISLVIGNTSEYEYI